METTKMIAAVIGPPAVAAVIMTGASVIDGTPAPTTTPVIAATTEPPAPCEPGSVYQDCISADEARTQITAAGRTWPEFLADTTARPRYERTFIRLWLDS